MRSCATLLLLLTIAGCNSGDSLNTAFSKRNVPSTIEPSEAPSDSWFTRVLGQAVIECQGACPKNVGLVAYYQQDFGEDTAIEQCTGFIVAPSVVATNSHCIPEVVKRGEISCNSRMGFVLPGPDGAGPVYRLCKRILAASTIGSAMDLDDYAFFEVEPLAAEPLVISQAGIDDGAQVWITKLNPFTGNGLGGSFETLKCLSVQKSLLNLYAIHPFSRTALAVGCEARPGNSGSPVMNASGEVIGILQSKKVAGYLLYLGEQLARKSQMELPQNPPEHFTFANLSCVAHPVSGAREQKECDYYRERSLAHIFNMIVDPSFESFGTIKSKWRYKLPDAFEYSIDSTSGFSTIFTATPICLKSDFIKGNSSGIYDFEFSNFLRIVKEYKFDEYVRFYPETYFREERASARYKLDTTGTPPKLSLVVENGVQSSHIGLRFRVCEEFSPL